MTMAPFHGNTRSEAAKMEQILTEFFMKSLHIILESRSPFVSSRNYSGGLALSSPSSSTSSSSSMRSRDKWFNLALKDCPAALENIDFWRQSNLEPMVVDVFLVQGSLDCDLVTCSPRLARNASSKDCFPNYWNSEQEVVGSAAKSEKIIERWVIQYESHKSGKNSSSRSREFNVRQILYKKLMLLLRSLYLTVRLLPAYKLFRDLNSSGQIHTCTLAPRLLSFAEPFTCSEEAEMQQFSFIPVDSSCGRLSVSVIYHSSVSDLIRGPPSTPITPRVIPDYVGSPIADPIKRFPSLPMIGFGSPSSSLGRPHSWSHDLFNAAQPPLCLPPHHPFDTSVPHCKNIIFDEYSPSPTIPDSSALSLSISIPGSGLSKVLLRSESAPMKSPGLARMKISQPSPPLSRLGSANADRFSGAVHTGATVDKLYLLGKDEPGKVSGAKTSCSSSPLISFNSSPRISVSRSSSRLSFLDDFDDSEFACPFFLRDDDVTETGGRAESLYQRHHPGYQTEPRPSFPLQKSHHAAVGELVWMLKKAQPLSQDPSNSINPCGEELVMPLAATAADSSSATSSRLVMPKTAADALEELHSYREMKDELLGKRSG